MDCLPNFEDESLPLLDDAGDKPLTCDAALSDREVRRFGGASEEKPGRVDCHACNFGEAEFPRFAFPGEGALLPEDDGRLLDPVLVLRMVGVADRGAGDEGLFGGVDGLRDGVADRNVGVGLD